MLLIVAIESIQNVFRHLTKRSKDTILATKSLRSNFDMTQGMLVRDMHKRGKELGEKRGIIRMNVMWLISKAVRHIRGSV